MIHVLMDVWSHSRRSKEEKKMSARVTFFTVFWRMGWIFPSRYRTGSEYWEQMFSLKKHTWVWKCTVHPGKMRQLVPKRKKHPEIKHLPGFWWESELHVSHFLQHSAWRKRQTGIKLAWMQMLAYKDKSFVNYTF